LNPGMKNGARLMNKMGAAEFYKGTWDTKGTEIINHIGCADCHDSKTMNLRISRPALLEAFEARGLDISKVSHQEMRSLVCAQCHVEYYFNKKKIEGVQYLVFPWKNGTAFEDIEKYYDETGFSDWTHALSRAPMLKAQHPDYEVYLTGVHASRGVSCADCHMPFISEGGQKFTDHHIQSPLNNISNSCQVCHREETADLIKGNSFHSPVELGRIISGGIATAQEARVKLARLLASLGYYQEVPYPDISTKAKAQEYVGLDMKKYIEDKKIFLETVLPEWIKAGKEREKAYDKK
jgi:formate-dependent nitrite reductase cytochrome c552 subunit